MIRVEGMEGVLPADAEMVVRLGEREEEHIVFFLSHAKGKYLIFTEDGAFISYLSSMRDEAEEHTTVPQGWSWRRTRRGTGRMSRSILCTSYGCLHLLKPIS